MQSHPLIELITKLTIILAINLTIALIKLTIVFALITTVIIDAIELVTTLITVIAIATLLITTVTTIWIVGLQLIWKHSYQKIKCNNIRCKS